MKVGVVGAAGYLGETLVKLLLAHPLVELAAVTSRTHAGKPLSKVLPVLSGYDQGLCFVNSDLDELAASDVELYFLALPHGAAATYAQALVKANKKVIDLSADFRISNLDVYQKYYGEHQAPELIKQASFVLPELTPTVWKDTAKLVAAPGCYPTSMLMPLVPLLKAGIVSHEHIVVNSFSGVSGAGKKLDEAYLYAERAENAKAYALTNHRHLAEVEEQLEVHTGEATVIQFNPHLAPMRRGIATTITIPALDPDIEKLYAAWESAYGQSPFVGIIPSGETPETAHVVGTNRINMSAVYDARTKNYVITTAEDNLMKGGSGQAVQIMNLWCGFPETAGLL